ncbi:Phosphoribosyl transferase domain protein [Lasiodiplodia theobromae]|uniref:Phosphoribosyl transferase domain protein n=1 Tax=Lasiodiplodia theobromae TaxID=45133 RepID=UPI0015C4061A|nr:Phosphoribosyl transferase domain protein [Lasiodiplodia theobromae]KAF4544061.1 Phosphoribosyl transferase domain protein [Lasiodiplodia theobromae]
MATLESLKRALKQEAKATASAPEQPLSETQYSAGFNVLVQDSGWMTYQDFIIPQLSQLLAPLFDSRIHISALEIGPGPKSVLGYLPDRLRRKIKRYTAFEPNEDNGGCSDDKKFDIILFCHSLYSMKPKRKFIEKALGMFFERPQDGMVVVFHRDEALHLDGLVCHQMASFPTGVVRVANDDETLNCFAPFIAGFAMQDVDVDKTIRAQWRKVCRALGRREEADPNHLLFSAPNVIAAFTRHATTLPELVAQVPLMEGNRVVKNRKARFHLPAAVVRPTEVRHIQQCIQWALEHSFSLAIIGGGHSSHCILPNVVSIDIDAFDQVHILTAGENRENSGSESGSLIVADAGCKTGDIIRKSMEAGVTVPLGARPSVGAGLWLQGGIGHLARLHGLACDSIVGAILVSVDTSQVLCIGHAIKGAGTNFGIVVSVTFKAYTAPTYFTQDWVAPLSDSREARRRLSDFDELVARKLPRNCSADAYLYWDADQVHFSMTTFQSSMTMSAFLEPTPTPVGGMWRPGDDFQTVDSVGLFETEMYLSGMHGGHSGGKTSSFKRCLFLNLIGRPDIADRLVAAIETRPTPLCYLHLLQGGGAIQDVEADASAFGCRDWDFACVITGVWPRSEDGTETARSAVRWVYSVAGDLLPFSSGAYGADLGPDPRDAALAAEAFGPNRLRLARLKHSMDPRGMLSYACPLPKAPKDPKLIILITGEICVGKDYCAKIWVSMFIRCI